MLSGFLFISITRFLTYLHKNLRLIFSIYKDKVDITLYKSFKLLITPLLFSVERYKYLLK